MTSALPDPLRAIAPSVPDWPKLARQQLVSLLTEIAAIEAKRDEASRLHAALTVYGVRDLPALPWTPGRSTPGRPRGPRLMGKQCAACGKDLHNKADGRWGADMRPYCIDAGRCLDDRRGAAGRAMAMQPDIEEQAS